MGKGVRIMGGGWCLGGGALDLPVVEFDRGETAEDGNGNLELASLGIDFVDAAGEVEEGTVVDFNFFTHRINDLGHFFARSGFYTGFDIVDLGLPQRRGMVTTNETNDAGGLFYEIPRFIDDLAVFIVQAHLDENVAVIKFADLRRLLPALYFRNEIGRASCRERV